MPTFHLNCRRCKQAATLIIIPLLYVFGFGVPKPPSIIRNVPKLTKRDAMARFMKENDVMVRLQNTIYSRRIQSVIEREMSENRLVEETPPRKDIRRNIKQIGNKVIRRGIPNCPQDPPVLGELNVNLTEVENVTMMDVIKEHRDVRRGGLWKPKHCHSSHRVAIVIPFRDREKHLNILLYHLLPLLKRQLIDFHIFVVEQVGNTTFNKGKLMNVGFLKAIEMGDFHCVIFHDVDLIPEDDRNLYRCTKIPRHLSVGVDSLKYIMPYDTLAGGVLNMPVETFLAVNGYSNMFWGWGGEDDEMGARIYETGIRIQRPPSHIAKYKMISHKKSPADHYDGVFKLLGSVPKRILSDGLNSIEYKLKGLRFMKLYTHIWVDVGLPPDATSKGKEGS